jgi:sugar phosphate isomerase/epimerase
VLADFYHMDEEKEPLDNIVAAKDLVKHIHVADTGRLAPGTGTYPYQNFVQCLARANYNDLVSIECNWINIETEVFQAKKFLTSMFN